MILLCLIFLQVLNDFLQLRSFGLVQIQVFYYLMKSSDTYYEETFQVLLY